MRFSAPCSVWYGKADGAYNRLSLIRRQVVATDAPHFPSRSE